VIPPVAFVDEEKRHVYDGGSNVTTNL